MAGRRKQGSPRDKKLVEAPVQLVKEKPKSGFKKSGFFKKKSKKSE